MTHPVTIRKVSTGEERTVEVTTIGGVYWWTDGNMSCDCNRSDLFGDADDTCGHSRFMVRIEALGIDELKSADSFFNNPNHH